MYAFQIYNSYLASNTSVLAAAHLTSPTASTSYASDEEFLEDAEIITETDADRKQTLLATEKDEDLKNLHSGTSWKDFENDFIFTGRGRTNVVVISSDEESGPFSATMKGKRKADAFEPLKGESHLSSSLRFLKLNYIRTIFQDFQKCQFEIGSTSGQFSKNRG